MPMRPAALLLDFGGVIGESDRYPTRFDDLAAYVHTLLDGAVPLDTIADDMLAASDAYGDYCHAMARPYEPVEVSHAQFWGDFVAADWPAAARERVLAEAADLSYRFSDNPTLRLRAGSRDVILAAAAAAVPMAVVSNVLCGAVVRAFLDREGVGSLFATQLYSDEFGGRKPGPGIVHAAAAALGVAVADCWFVGDTPLRDVLAARRAGVGHVVLVDAGDGPKAQRRGLDPDIALDSMVDVHRHLLTAL